MKLHDLVNDIETRAVAAGLNVTELCRRADIARSTFTRWKKGQPPSTRLLAHLEKVVITAERQSKRRAA